MTAFISTSVTPDIAEALSPVMEDMYQGRVEVKK
jgi:hypothetical protein